MMRVITKIYFIGLILSFFGVKAQDTLNMAQKQHFFASLQAGSTFFGNFSANGDVIPISALYLSYIPKNSKIIISAGPSISPVFDQVFFGAGINAKVFLGKKIHKHNFVFEAGDRICWSQETFNTGSVIQTNKYSLNNLYTGLGYMVFLGKENKFFLSLTGSISINEYNAKYGSVQVSGPQKGLNAFTKTTIAPGSFLNAGMKLR